MAEVLTMIKIKCQDCGKEFDVSPAEQKFFSNKNYTLPKRCPECRKSKRVNIVKITCIDCNAEFELDGYEQEYFNKKGYEFPKRCRSCREIKKRRNLENNNANR